MFLSGGSKFSERGTTDSKSPDNVDVLDLCVRTRKKDDFCEKTRDGYFNSCVEYNDNLQVKEEKPSPVLVQHPFYRTPEVNGSLTLLTQDRLFTGEALCSPTAQSETHHSSYSHGSSSPLLSPSFVAPPIAATTRGGKSSRPFKVYPKNPLSLATDDLEDSKEYAEFREMVMARMHHSNGSPAGNKNMKRPVRATSPNQLPSSSEDAKDKAYWERRKKNNEAAKRSRDARRAKEDEMATRALYLERENPFLKAENRRLKSENERLKCIIESITKQPINRFYANGSQWAHIADLPK